MFERELRDLSYVPRWSIVRVSKPQSVAEHSFYTAMYAYQIADTIGYRYRGDVEGCREKLLLAALWHDAEESFMGDMPGPTKHRLMGMEAKDKIVASLNRRFGSQWSYFITAEERRIVKTASLLDDAMFLMGEIQRGNKACEAAKDSVMVRLRKSWFELPAHQDMLTTMWNTVILPAIKREATGTSTEPDE